MGDTCLCRCSLSLYLFSVSRSPVVLLDQDDVYAFAIAFGQECCETPRSARATGIKSNYKVVTLARVSSGWVPEVARVKVSKWVVEWEVGRLVGVAFPGVSTTQGWVMTH